MLPSSLKSIYRQYKADTDSVATWLATTAKANGYVDDTGNALVAAGGKKKKKKKKKTNADSAPKPRYVLRIKDFEPMARFIAKLESINIPEDFAIALERVIWVRKTFVDLLADNGIPTRGDIDATHSYFADVLESVGRCLQPLVKAPAFKAPEPKVLERSRDCCSQAYARRGVRSLWKRHLEGSLDLAAAAVATNTAFELARSMEEEVKPLLNKHDGVDQLITVYFQRICEACGVDVEYKGQNDPYNLVAYDLAKACFANGLSMLRDYAVENAGDNIISKYNGKWGWYDEALAGDAWTNRGKWDQDFLAFNGVITELQFLASNMGQGARIEDEFIRGVGALMNSTEQGGQPDMNLWLSFALQTYIEVLQSFGKNCGDAYEQMQQECRRIKKAMLNVPRMSKDRDNVLNSVTKWDKDPIWHCRHKMIRLGIMPRPNPPQFLFLRRNPIHCGLLLHEIRTTFHISGVRYAAHSGGLMAITQLYHALHNEKLLPEEVVWEDLDEFWKRQGNSAFFVGDPPTDREGYFRNYCLSIGLSASNWAPTKRQGKVNVNTANRRNLKFNGWVSLTMKNRLVPTGDRTALSPDVIEGILLDGRRHEIMDGKGHVRPELKEKTDDDKVDFINLSPASLIEKLALDVHDDVPKITFDLFTLHNAAWDLLTKLKGEFTKVMGTEFLRYVPREELLPFVVGYVFSTAAGRQDIETKTESVDILINAAGRFVKGFLEKGKGTVVKEGSKAIVKPQEVANIQFNATEPWGLDHLMAELQREAGRRGGGRGGGEQCPTQ
ncbi:uncharacterized protein NECHADRAFT_75637 [Fusarium vanettenii 77-13-4]|uniref:DUF6604 domain-containing protein n=1 Tax=Fusarium vanettenii (strain ATCC MYA-4622 / CBS 123669 / FGSC 9596 / NRRL 45880 / 77-13-4) TaxID=660122 RepID=C7YJD2_FUSV7|nr:uncharacterized protein NECHADRAFT_75637 [Fusarium vanettenii 77-13-4]EEU48956.1 hypothetical protein NECHADRAFT_75637 [Fusarium vanettenii 77-13-4]